MKPIRAKHLTESLQGGPKEEYGTLNDVSDLPVRRVGNTVVSCWRPSLLERLSILFCGRVWLHILGTTHSPVSLTGCRTFLWEE